MRICIDIDGTICHLPQPSQRYHEVMPIPGAAAKIKRFKENGHYIIFCTARHMKTCDSIPEAFQNSVFVPFIRTGIFN